MPLPERTHTRFLELIETQVCQYVMTVTAGCPPLPTSVLQGRSDSSATPSGGKAAAPCARLRELEAQPLRQLYLRLNDCEWAGEQLLVLVAKLRADVPGFGRLGSTLAQPAIKRCETACRDLLDYIPARIAYYDLEPELLSRLLDV